ncbi:Multidrug resistance efflux pump [Butyrivibrio hungatei]|uniref:Multidrug resistance efflux pump n=1 Tax=Butyrivibrio hungatei TaxID=185008 RepID=A0A1G5GID5_9FIRM|nr:HlyD family efflux transporter periplasmic adaptor subunit [Butyrivibrio hungatei]SCY51131.1 Multidrug resistance efflux pump [Butyrivibrio hungatei]
MKNKIKTIDELRDSRIMYDKEPPAFGYAIVILVAFICLAALVWSVRTPKTYVIQASGTVTSEKSNYVMCTYTGEITDCRLSEGMLVKDGDELFKVKSTDYNIQAQQLKLSKESYQESIEKNQLLVKSIKDDTNYFSDSNPDDVLFYSAFESYKSQVKQNTMDTSVYDKYDYSDEQIEAELEKNEGKISQIYYDAISSAEKTIAEAKQHIEAIDAQISAIGSGQSEYTIKANATGRIHLLADYKDGMVVQTTQTVASITPANTSSILEAFVSTSDMARMHVGDEVQIVIDGLAQNVYGTIGGAVKQIDSNVSGKEGKDGSVNQVFKVLVEMDSDYVVSRNGDKVDVVNGMTGMCRITYDKVTYFNYALEKLGVKTRK